MNLLKQNSSEVNYFVFSHNPKYEAAQWINEEVYKKWMKTCFSFDPSEQLSFLIFDRVQ